MIAGDAAHPRLREALADPGAFPIVVEIVPWRGALRDDAGARALALARGIGEDPRFGALSVTDSAGGHAMLSPEIIARELSDRGQETIVHVVCRDRNRNELLSLGWRLASMGLENVLALSGDYPATGSRGVARPVFDLDSVGLLDLYAGLNEGRVGRDGAAGHANGLPPARTDFLLGAAINPFKRLERDLLPQYQKLELKAGAGARFAITQVGYDARKLDELVRFVRERNLPLRLVANVFMLSRTTARLFAAGKVPGVVLSGDLAARVERESASADKGREFRIEFAARQVAIARGLGYAGAYLGGSTRAEDYGAVLDRVASFATDDWRMFADAPGTALPGTFYLYESGEGDLNGPRRAPLGRPRRAPLAYRANRLVHRVAFEPGTAGFRAGARAYGALERGRLGRVAHVAEQAIKVPLFDCRDCGDCSLPEIAYLCPESQCAKNQRNGPCGGSLDGACEVPGRPCIWARAYERLRPYGEAESMLARPPTLPDNALRRTSAWANTYLGRDHVTRHAPPARD